MFCLCACLFYCEQPDSITIPRFYRTVEWAVALYSPLLEQWSRSYVYAAHYRTGWLHEGSTDCLDHAASWIVCTQYILMYCACSCHRFKPRSLDFFFSFLNSSGSFCKQNFKKPKMQKKVTLNYKRLSGQGLFHFFLHFKALRP